MRLPRIGFRRLTNVAIGLAFLTGCVAPLVRYFSRPAPEMMEQEKRKAAPLPATLFASDFPEKFDAYFRDAFGFRRSLVRTYTVAKVRGLGVSCNPQVVVGKKGWLFIDEHRSIDDYRGKVLYDEATLEKWRTSLEHRRDRLARRGIALLYVFTPSKEEIYPEYLPAWIRAGRPNRLDQLLTYLKAHSDVPVLDLRPALLAAKKQGELYRRRDTHWNDLGAYYGARAILETLAVRFPAIHPMPMTNLVPVSKREKGDLAAMLGLADDWMDPHCYLNFRTMFRSQPGKLAWKPEQLKPAPYVMWAKETGDKTLPRVYLCCDSYCWAMGKLLEEHFQRTVYAFYSWGLDYRFIADEKPDLVLEEMQERFLDLPVPVDGEDGQ